MYFHLLIEVVVSWLEYVSELHSPISLVTQLLYYQLSDGLRLVLENLFRNWQVDSANKLPHRVVPGYVPQLLTPPRIHSVS
mgnify:CR=1 FL=1